MSNLLGLSSSFLGEAATLFSDQKTIQARGKVIEWLNELATANTQVKSENLMKIQEILLNSCTELLEEFLENVISYSQDSAMDIRKIVVGFIEQMCKEKIEFFPRISNILSMMLRDNSPQVIKRVIQASSSIYKNTLVWICSAPDITDSIEETWNTLSMMKAQILDMIDHDNDGIRTNAIKFLEGVVILQTYPDEDSMKRDKDFSLEDIPLTLKLIRRRKLEDEARDIFDCLLKFHAAVHISSVNLIACTGSLCTIAKMRPALMIQVIRAIENLHSNLPPTLTDSQVSSVRKNLKMQLLNLLKNRGSFEMQATIFEILKDLGASQQDIMRSIPKMDKAEQQRRLKRAHENSSIAQAAKRPRKETTGPVMEIDYDVLEEQKSKSNKINEKFLNESLKNIENVVELIIKNMVQLPDTVSDEFLLSYKPPKDASINQQVIQISNIFAEQLSDLRLGPGSSAFSKEPPMKLSESGEIEAEDIIIDENQKKEEATKKLRETIERQKGQQAVIARMKQRAKTLKLQEVTKPLSRTSKEKFLVDAVQRILNAELVCTIGGVSVKRRKILTVMGATFPDKIREIIYKFIMEDLKNRIDLAFNWLYEEYCLLQGFTRHSYVKSENRPDFAYNQLLGQLIDGICSECEFKDKIKLLRRLFLESPNLPDEAVNRLIQMCEKEETSFHCLDLLKDLAIRRPPRKQKFVKILLNYSVHENLNLRERSLDNLITLYAIHKILTLKIEEFAIQWLNYLKAEIPPMAIFGKEYGRMEPQMTWTEDLVKLCLNLFLALMPYKDGFLNTMCKVFTTTADDTKRTIFRSIDGAIKKMGSESPQIIKLIEECPKGTETLITRIIYILTDRTIPNPEFVQRVRDLHKKLPDVRLLIPVLAGLTKKEIISILPKFLKLNPIIVKEVFSRLLGIGAEFANQNIAITPSEILIQLHTIDPAKCELKYVVKATSLCLVEKEIYTQEVLATCLQQLIEIYPLPTLLMRTVIQSLTLYPRLSNFVVNLLQRLILKQVWKNKVIWDGFLKCSQRLRPQSLPVLIQLPHPQLLDAINQCPDLRQPLIEHAQSIQDQNGIISQQTLNILHGLSEDVFVTDETGGYISVENIKQEVEEHSITDNLLVLTAPIISRTSTGQPLPPGEE